MAGLFKNYFHGTPGKRDFTVADLPENRVQLFKQVLGVRMGGLVGLNLLYLLIWLPAIVWTFLVFASFMAVNVPSAEEVQQALYTWVLVLFPLIAITGPFNAGISYVLHRWARDEHSFAFSDFKDGVKENWKQGLLFGIVDGLVPLLLFFCDRFYLGLAERSPLFYLPLAAAFIAGLIWFLAAPVVPVLMVSYRQSFGGHLRNAILLTLAQLPRSVAIRLLTLAMPIAVHLCLVFFSGAIGWVSGVAMVLYTVILLAFNRLIWASYANFLGEKYLNPKIPGARTDIGLRPRDLP